MRAARDVVGNQDSAFCADQSRSRLARELIQMCSMTAGVFPIYIKRRRRSAQKWACIVIFSPIAYLVLRILAGVPQIPSLLFLWLLWTGVLLFLGIHFVAKWSERRFMRFVVDSQYRVCPVCGYRLARLPDQHRCPECGLRYDIDSVRQVWQIWRNKDIGLWFSRRQANDD